MQRIRSHLTYANVMATLAAFVVLIGGTAYAANQLAKNSIGKKQLKAKSVTTAKIKKNAVTTGKIKGNAVTAAKVRAASLTDAELSGAVPFTRVVEELRGSTTVALPSEPGMKFTIYPISGAYTQEAGRTDLYVGYADVTIAPACTDPQVLAFLTIDPTNPGELSMLDIGSIAGIGIFQETGNISTSARINIGPFPGGGSRFAPTGPTSRNLVLAVKSVCSAGDGVTVTDAGIDVIGIK